MNIVPALQQQKILVISGVVIVAIVFFGSYLASRQAEINQPAGENPATQGTQQSASPLTLLLQEASEPEKNGQISYTLKVASAEESLQSIGLRLTIDGGTVVKSSQSAFSSNSELSEQGWQAAVNSSIETENNRSVMEVGFVNLKPEGVPVKETLVLGQFTVKPATAGQKPQFSIDQAVSTAFTKNGSSMQINLILEPQVVQ